MEELNPTDVPLRRADIEERLRQNLNMTVFGARAMAKAILQVYSRHLIEGNTIELRTVGKFESRIEAARMHHVVNAKGASSMKMTPARRVLRFSPSKKLRERMIRRNKAQNS
ncbi:MAG: HU family DNA-binding protein [Bacteroidetes bacterium SB0662_bin_6]|nr:HU family DNA-binding protein [Gammaproteobacteria bacterium]MYE04866.1 HU family DNA-binding protein [Bacteroidetes bacterium SB0662_bin_6]